jgi:hypothetical protein
LNLVVEVSNSLTSSYKSRSQTDTLLKHKKDYKLEQIKDGETEKETRGEKSVLRALMRVSNK